MVFETDVKVLFNKVDPNVRLNFGVLLENGKVYIDLREDPANAEIKLKKIEAPDFTIEDEIIRYHIDSKFSYFFFILVRTDMGEIKMLQI